jgi:exocyst complex component 1
VQFSDRNAKLRLISISLAGRTPIQSDYLRSTRNGPVSNGLPSSVASQRSPVNPVLRSSTPQGNDDVDRYPPADVPASRNQPRVGLPSRSDSPMNSNRSFPASNRPGASTPSRNRAPSPTNSQASGIRPRPGRRPSTADSTSSQIPAIKFPQGSPTRPSISTPTTRPSHETRQSFSGSRPALDVNLPTSFSSISPQSTYSPLSSSLQPALAERKDRSTSPASSGRKQSSRGITPAPSETAQVRREHNTRVSFFDPANQASLDRLIASEPGAENDLEGEETAQATMTSVEEMLEGYEWAGDDVIGRKTARGTADLIEARLLDELMALEKVNRPRLHIFNFLLIYHDTGQHPLVFGV